HNRDNARGLGAFRVPICPASRVQDFGFHGLDRTGAGDWPASRSGDAIVFETGSNPLRWNMIFNFWFDCDAGPATDRALELDEFDPGAGAPAINVILAAPTALSSVTLGPGCGLPDVPTLYTLGTPPSATVGNATFALG